MFCIVYSVIINVFEHPDRGGGRPRGNTAQLVDAFSQGAQEAGHKVEIISLSQHEVHGCMGCNACRYGKPCVRKDAFNTLAPKIRTTDLLVLASPLYFWTISSALKAFIERFYCLAEEDPCPPLGRYERYPVHDVALLMTAAITSSGPSTKQCRTTASLWLITSVAAIMEPTSLVVAETPMVDHALLKQITSSALVRLAVPSS